MAILCVALWAIGSTGAARPDERPEALERSVKAAFLYKFGGYVDWQPTAFATPDAPFTIGVVGDDALARELADVVVDRMIGKRRVVAVALNATDPIDGVQMLFIGRSSTHYLPQLVRTIPARPILLVTEWEGALEHGSVINFVLRNARVRFEISVSAAELRGLVLSSRLLAVAHSVVTGTP